MVKLLKNFAPWGATGCRGVPWGVIVGVIWLIYKHFGAVGCQQLCETRQVLLVGVSGGFPGYSRFAQPIDWLVSMSEISLKGTLN